MVIKQLLMINSDCKATFLHCGISVPQLYLSATSYLIPPLTDHPLSFILKVRGELCTFAGI